MFVHLFAYFHLLTINKFLKTGALFSFILKTILRHENIEDCNGCIDKDKLDVLEKNFIVRNKKIFITDF